MKDLVSKYWMMTVLVTAPLARHFSENGTIDALTGLAVWSILWIIFAIVVILFLIGAVCHFMPDEITKVEGVEKMTKPFKKMRWWKSAINMSIVLSVYIYVDWAGPAILYTITSVGLLCGVALLKSGIMKVLEAHGIELPVDEDEKPDELKNLKTNSLEN